MTSSKFICPAFVQMHVLDRVKISSNYRKSIDGSSFWFVKETSKNVVFGRIRPRMPKWWGVMFEFLGFQCTVFMPSPIPYFMSDFNNLKIVEKKNTKIFDF